jgi:hypothetical protein
MAERQRGLAQQSIGKTATQQENHFFEEFLRRVRCPKSKNPKAFGLHGARQAPTPSTRGKHF